MQSNERAERGATEATSPCPFGVEECLGSHNEGEPCEEGSAPEVGDTVLVVYVAGDADRGVVEAVEPAAIYVRVGDRVEAHVPESVAVLTKAGSPDRPALVERTVRHSNGSIDYVTDLPGGERWVGGSLVSYGLRERVTGVARWYNRTTRDWVVMLVDAEGNQVGSSEYMYSKQDAIDTVANWVGEALTGSPVLSDRRSAGEVSTPATEQRPTEGQEGASQMSPEEQTAREVRDLSPEDALAFVLDPRRGDLTFDVMGANVTSDCPNDADHDEDGTCHCVDGVTLDEVATALQDGGAFLDSFADYGPFTLWVIGEDPGSPQAPRQSDIEYLARESGLDVSAVWDGLDHVGHMAESDIECPFCRSITPSLREADEEEAGSIPDDETIVTLRIALPSGVETPFSIDTESVTRRDALVAFLLTHGITSIETSVPEVCADCGEPAEAHGMWSEDLSHTFS